jgi:hypothetical protein
LAPAMVIAVSALDCPHSCTGTTHTLSFKWPYYFLIIWSLAGGRKSTAHCHCTESLHNLYICIWSYIYLCTYLLIIFCLVWKGNNFTVVNLPSSEGSDSQNFGLYFRETIKPVVSKENLWFFNFFAFKLLRYLKQFFKCSYENTF